MAKIKTVFLCNECGFASPRWLGKCPSCGSWNSFSEEIEETKKAKTVLRNDSFNITPLTAEITHQEIRISSGIEEFDRVLGGGLVVGSVVLLGGDPGIGKSTLVMQMADSLNCKILYVTGEESINQINLRARRLNISNKNISVASETNVQTILQMIKKYDPAVVIIDSIQTMHSDEMENAPGTVTQIRESTLQLMQMAKSSNISVIIIGHVTKDGMIAGPKVLEHIVDTVLQFEGEKNHTYRILRGQKNRFGSTNEIGIFEMREEGLTEVKNPSLIFLSGREEGTTGSVVAASIEGTRPILLEVQALVTPSNFGNPQRVATGFDYRRLSILLAVLEKRAGLRLSAANVFVNMAGGVRIEEPAVDLAVCTSIASSFLDRPARNGFVCLGEVGLGGEIRSVGQIEKRIQEAEKLGFKFVLIPSGNYQNLKKTSDIKLIPVSNINQAINELLEEK